MMIDLAVVTASAGHVLAASSSSDDGGTNLGLVFLLSGFIFYGIVYLRYRNVDKRQRYEAETEAKLLDMQAGDQFVRSMTGLSNRHMSGANNTEVRGVLRRFF